MNLYSIRIIIADDHEIVRDGLMTIIKKYDDMQVIAEASSGEQLIRLAEQLLPDVIVTDIKLQGMNGIEATRIISEKIPAISVIALSMLDNPHVIAEMIDAGALGFLVKDSPKDNIIEGIRTVSRNKEYFCTAAAKKMTDALAATNGRANRSNWKMKKLKFTDREKEIIRLVCKGLSTPEISKTIFLSPKTVENYRSRLLEKTGCKNMSEFTFFISQNNLYEI